MQTAAANSKAHVESIHKTRSRCARIESAPQTNQATPQSNPKMQKSPLHFWSRLFVDQRNGSGAAIEPKAKTTSAFFTSFFFLLLSSFLSFAF